MKKQFARFVLFLFVATTAFLPASAQKKLSEGTILYDITIASDNSKPQNADFLNGATNAVYLEPGKSRTEMISSLGTQTTIITQTGAKKDITILKEYGDQKYLISLTAADWTDLNKRNEAVTFTYDATASKTIQGYAVKKATGTFADGTTFTVWYTPDVIIDNKDFQYANRNLPGLALEYETIMGNLKVTYTAAKVSFAPVPSTKFDLPKSGFRVISYAESKGGK